MKLKIMKKDAGAAMIIAGFVFALGAIMVIAFGRVDTDNDVMLLQGLCAVALIVGTIMATIGMVKMYDGMQEIGQVPKVKGSWISKVSQKISHILNM